MADLIDAVADGEFVYLTRRGRRVAALMPADVAGHHEQIEDDYWARRPPRRTSVCARIPRPRCPGTR
ncbi:MAG: type II toxin-antitoxin system prevent-host-death family antitoxin [Actinomycetota bacterium]|nr:type II toxin-antitoxin system prevent-host-death family antitoxin [Actinomycetota bacterium]